LSESNIALTNMTAERDELAVKLGEANAKIQRLMAAVQKLQQQQQQLARGEGAENLDDTRRTDRGSKRASLGAAAASDADGSDSNDKPATRGVLQSAASGLLSRLWGANR